MREQRTIEIEGQTITFEAWPEHGAWYEEGHNPESEDTGFLYAPMKLDGSFDPEEVHEVEIPYSVACEGSRFRSGARNA